MTFTTSTVSVPPTVTTNAATNVTSSSATLNGTVNANGLSTLASFKYGKTSGSTDGITTIQSISGSSNTTVSGSISGLSAGTTYYYSLYANNSAGSTFGNEMTFTTSTVSVPPTVTTNAATNVTSSSATLNGTVNANGLSTTVTFKYGKTSGSYDSLTTVQSISGLSDTAVSSSISGLSAGTTYYYTLVAQNSAGYTTGSEMSFTSSTDSVPPTVTTKAATNVTSNSATLNGTVNANGLSTTVTFKYGKTSGSFDSLTTVQSVSGSSDTAVSSSISGLSAGTTYYYTLVASNSAGYTTGSEMSFTSSTDSVPPTVTTKAATNVTSSSATLNGTVNANGLSTLASFEYGKTSGSTDGITTIQSISGSSDTTVSSSISGLSAGTTYYYSLVAGSTTGNEMTFTTSTIITPTPTPTPTPSPIQTPTPTKESPKIAAGGYHNIVLKLDGTVWAWGYNVYGQLGDASNVNKSTPVKNSGLSNITVAAGGSFHSISLKSNGTVYVWGRNNWGQFGDGSNADRNTPIQNSSLSNVTDVSAGYYYSMFLKSDGNVWTCGGNYRGQLGDGTTTDRDTPVQVSGLSDVIAIAAGRYHSMALKSDGTVWAWGDNTFGQLGDGTNTLRTTPVKVNGISNVTAIAVGEHFSIALKSDGTVKTWGYNGDSQLGDGSNTNRSSPVQVSGISGVTAIAAGEDHGMALKSDGTVWLWGYNNYGQLGDGTFSNKSTPVQVNNLNGVTAIACGYSHSIVLKSDGTLWAWGRNDSGQLGDGTTNDRNTPVQVDINLGEMTIPPMVTTGSATNVTSSSATLNGTVNANGLSTYASFKYGKTSGSSDGITTIQSISGTSDTTVSSSITGLSAGTTYYYSLAAGSTLGNEMTFTTSTDSVSPTVTTKAATNVTSSSATLNGTVNANGLSTYASFRYGKTSGSSDGITTIQSISGTSDTAVSSNITGLSAGTTYYYSLAAGSTLGNEMTFTTQTSTKSPIVTTGSASNITSNSSTLNGTVNANGLSTTGWFAYGKSSGSYSSKSSTQSISGTSNTAISIGISGLSAGTTYYYKLVAQNSAGTTNGTEMSFTATAVGGTPPTVTTKAATNVTSSSATLNGTVNANGLSTTVTFKYGKTSGSYDSLTTVQSVSGSGNTAVSSSITGLSVGTTYYYTLVAQNSAGYTTGSEMSFTTSSIISPTPTTTAAPTPFPTTIPLATPTVETKAATNVTSNSAALNGTVNANGLLTLAWFNYGTNKGWYNSTLISELVNGSSDTTISIGMSGLSAGTTYFYQLAAQNSAGTSFGNEMSFTTSSTTFPTPFLTPTATAVPTPTPTLSQSPPFGLTIITHGYQLDGGYPSWVDDMAVAIANKCGGTSTVPIYTITISKKQVTTFSYEDVVTFEPEDLDFKKFKKTGSAIIKVDWSAVSSGNPLDCDMSAYTDKIGNQIYDKLEGTPYLEVPIHLIGHSRGASVISRLAYKLGISGIWVDHFTSLDPQPLTLCGDWDVKIYPNVLFADNNYRSAYPADLSWIPYGEPVDYTYERKLNGVVTDIYSYFPGCGEYGDHVYAHELVHTYYHGTIDTNIDCVDQRHVQDEWYNDDYPRKETGYYFSRIGGGDRYGIASSGLHYRLSGTSTNRKDFGTSTTSPAWPNVTFKPFADQSGYSDYEVKVGKKVVFTFYYQDVDSDNLDIVFALDNDTNPFNNSDNKYYKKIGSPKGKTKKRGTISAKTKFEWVPKYADIGTHYVQIKATDADGQVRYDYLLKPINVKTTRKRVRSGH